MSNSEEQTFRSRVHNAYHKLCKSHLVMRKDVSEGSLKFFEERLNEAMPRDDLERDQVRIIKDLYYNAPRLTYQAITAERDGMNKQALYVLWTNAWCITRHFEIESIVHLDWDATQNLYHARLPDPEKDNKEQPPQKPRTKFEHKPKAQPQTQPAGDKPADNWRTVGEKPYRPRRGKHNERRGPRKPKQETPTVSEPSQPVDTPATIAKLQESVENSIKKGDPWD